MSRNYMSLKTGHAVSDAYFKKQPIWCDSDLLHALLLGAACGIFGGLFFAMMM